MLAQETRAGVQGDSNLQRGRSIYDPREHDDHEEQQESERMKTQLDEGDFPGHQHRRELLKSMFTPHQEQDGNSEVDEEKGEDTASG
jgi:hypothetical protein